MAKRREVAEIGKRAAQEVLKIWDNFADATRAIGCGENTMYVWYYGRSTPSAVFLAKLYEHGADVIWILTGRRAKHETRKEANSGTEEADTEVEAGLQGVAGGEGHTDGNAAGPPPLRSCN